MEARNMPRVFQVDNSALVSSDYLASRPGDEQAQVPLRIRCTGSRVHDGVHGARNANFAQERVTEILWEELYYMYAGMWNI